MIHKRSCEICVHRLGLEGDKTVCTRHAPCPTASEVQGVTETQSYLSRRPLYGIVHPDHSCGDFVFNETKLDDFRWKIALLEREVGVQKCRAQQHKKVNAKLRRGTRKLKKKIDTLEDTE